jgi:ElaA protein
VMAEFDFVKPGGRVIAEASARLNAFSVETESEDSRFNEIQWQWAKFPDLSVKHLYEMIALREKVFVVEQECVYLDCDGKDYDSWHLLGWKSNEQQLVAYLRVLPPGLRFTELSIGRVVTSPDFRRQGIGRQLLQEGIRRIHETFGSVPIRIAAQAYLLRFYTELGFQKDSEEFLEDNIPHIEMIKP